MFSKSVLSSTSTTHIAVENAAGLAVKTVIKTPTSWSGVPGCDTQLQLPAHPDPGKNMVIGNLDGVPDSILALARSQWGQLGSELSDGNMRSVPFPSDK